jgi:hypothetical protein
VIIVRDLFVQDPWDLLDLSPVSKFSPDRLLKPKPPRNDDDCVCADCVINIPTDANSAPVDNNALVTNTALLMIYL